MTFSSGENANVTVQRDANLDENTLVVRGPSHPAGLSGRHPKILTRRSQKSNSALLDPHTIHCLLGGDLDKLLEYVAQREFRSGFLGIPERDLLIAVLERAIADYGCDDPELQAEAVEWFFCEEDDMAPFSFRWVSTNLNLQPTSLRKNIEILSGVLGARDARALRLRKYSRRAVGCLA